MTCLDPKRSGTMAALAGQHESISPMPENEDFYVRFWGVRGSISVCDENTVRYGGNTSCLEIRCGKKLLIFDAGTGIRYLGNELAGNGAAVEADVFLTHTHYDHIGGIPFFKPFFVPGNKFRMWAGHLLPDSDVRCVLCDLMMAPLFPVPLEIFQSKIEFHDFGVGEMLTPCADVAIHTAPLNHPNAATAYRINYGGRSICYLNDTEHKPGEIDETIRDLIEGADIAIYDAMFTEEEYKDRVGWGHSTWEAGVELCDAANVKKLVIFHHDPDHDDAFMDGIAEAAERRRPGTVVAREGLTLRP